MEKRHIRIALVISLLAGALMAAGSGWWILATHSPLKLLIQHRASDSELNKLASIMGNKDSVDINVIKTVDGDSSVTQRLSQGDVDLAIVENSQPFSESFQVVAPLYRSVLHIFYRDGLKVKSAKHLFTEHSIYVDPLSYTSRRLIELVQHRHDIKAKDIELVSSFSPGNTDVFITFAPLQADKLNRQFQGYRLLAFDPVEQIGHGSSIDAIGLMFPQLQPFIIPARTYQNLGNDKPVATVSVDMLLVASTGLSEHLVYRLAASLFDLRTQLAEIIPSAFMVLREDFDVYRLNFPLHTGARRYLERNSPSFLERYAELINVVIYMTALGFTALLGFFRWNKQRKKDRVDEFYIRVLKLKQAAKGELSTRQLLSLQGQLDQLEHQAFELLIAEKLAADESFRILITLVQEVNQLLVRPNGAGEEP